jgi:1-acyl-sn-glycerol-3-phosphate acyltransferase
MRSLRGLTALLLHIGNSLLWCLPLYALIPVKLLAFRPSWRARVDRLLAAAADGWVGGTLWLTRRLQSLDLELEPLPELAPQGRYLVVCNHQSWVDIIVLIHLLPRTIPFPRFFTKKEMLWLPLLGIAFWALDFPIMHRYSREFLERHPHLRGRDLLNARRACERFRKRPVTIVNFLEGTRLTPEKHARQESPYRHLLRPRFGGVALVVNALGEDLDAVLDLTVVYPAGVPNFWDFLCGHRHPVRATSRVLGIPPRLRGGDYGADGEYRRNFQVWIEEIWEEKDRSIAGLLAKAPAGGEFPGR